MVSKSVRAIITIILLIWISFASTQGKANAVYTGLAPNATVYQQPPDPNGGLYRSSWLSPSGSQDDRYVWDNFTLPLPRLITEADWIGGYDPTLLGSGGPVLDFTVAFYPSNIAGQPDISNPPAASYQVGGNANETLYGVLGGVTMYNYSFVLPAPFAASAGIQYWVQIYAWQGGDPDWGLTKGTGGEDVHFLKLCRFTACTYHLPSGDVAFTLMGSVANQVWLPLITR